MKVFGPPGWPVGEYMEVLNSRQVKTSKGYRQSICERNPILFGLIYYARPERLLWQDGNIYLNDMHISVARGARRWARKDLKPHEVREATIGPRGAAKSMWLATILPTWAAVFGHRRFMALFGSTQALMKATHFKNLVDDIRENDLLRHDYPRFCSPLPGAGSVTTDQYLSENGSIILARGFDQRNLGLNIRGFRPDYFAIDDPEADDGNFTLAAKTKRLKTIRQGILGMNPKAVVQWVGTTTAYGSLAHDLVRDAVGESTADWVRETEFKTAHYPAIMVDPATGTERSLWPVMWDLEYLRSQRGIYDFELNLMNRPPSTGGTMWAQRHFVYGVPKSWDFSRYVLRIDPAVTSKATSDYTGIAVGGFAANVRKAAVLMSASIRVSPEGLKRNVELCLARYPEIREIQVEGNQGMDYLSHALQGLPRHLRITLPRSDPGQSKAVRFGKAFTHYERGRVVHASQFRVAEDQMKSFPNGQFDDGADAVCGAVNELLAHLPTAATAGRR